MGAGRLKLRPQLLFHIEFRKLAHSGSLRIPPLLVLLFPKNCNGYCQSPSTSVVNGKSGEEREGPVVAFVFDPGSN